MNPANGRERKLYHHHQGETPLHPMQTPSPWQVPSPSSWVLTHVPQFELAHGPLLGAALRQQVDPDLPVGDWGRFRWPVVITEDLEYRKDGVPVRPVRAQVPLGDLPAPWDHLESSSCVGSQGRSQGAGRGASPAHQELCTAFPHLPFVWISASSREKELCGSHHPWRLEEQPV